MKEIYRITIHGRILESRDLKQLLSRAVNEKRAMDRRRRFQHHSQPLILSGIGIAALAGPDPRALARACRTDPLL